MRFLSAPFIALFVLFAGFSGGASAFALERPESGILDQAQILPLSMLKATERIFSEHQRLTQETIFLVTFSESPSGDLEEEAHTLVEDWKRETPRPPNVVLIAVDAKKGELAIRSGIGLDSVFGAGSERVREIRQNYFAPEWKTEKRHRAVILSVIEAMRALESPLISSGEAVDAYEHAGFSGGWNPAPVTPRTSTTWIWMVLGAIIFAFALYRTLAVEIHTTGEGWRRIPVSEVLIRRLRKSKAPPLVTGGGVSGKY